MSAGDQDRTALTDAQLDNLIDALDTPADVCRLRDLVPALVAEVRALRAKDAKQTAEYQKWIEERASEAEEKLFEARRSHAKEVDRLTKTLAIEPKRDDEEFKGIVAEYARLREALTSIALPHGAMGLHARDVAREALTRGPDGPRPCPYVCDSDCASDRCPVSVWHRENECLGCSYCKPEHEANAGSRDRSPR